jgi:hypothetical protein
MENLLEWLQTIYANELCDGSWEHANCISISNIDNPGWVFRFDIKDLAGDTSPFPKIIVKNSDTDWYTCEISEQQFIGAGGATNLVDIIAVFKDWYLNSADDSNLQNKN